MVMANISIKARNDTVYDIERECPLLLLEGITLAFPHHKPCPRIILSVICSRAIVPVSLHSVQFECVNRSIHVRFTSMLKGD
jgi:hypothetical protein